MKPQTHKLRKTFIIITGSIVIAIVAVILFISPIAKYVGIKYGEKYTGRQIKTGLVYVNPFTGFVHISNLKVFEPNGDSVFFSAKGVNATFALFKLLSKNIEISEITLDEPMGTIVQNNKDLNFDDLIVRYTPDKSDTTPSAFKFNILNVTIKNGTFYYREKVIPINYFIKEVNIESAGWHWKADTIGANFYILSGTGSGSAKGNITINFNNLDYRVAAVVHKFDLKILGQYLKALTNYGTFSSNLDADIKATGKLNDEENVTAKGLVALNDFHFGRNIHNDYASFDRLVLKIDELSPKKHKYLFDSLFLSHPFFKYELYDSLDNLQRMFGKNGVNISAVYDDHARFNLIIEIAKYLEVLVKNFFYSNYKINKLAIYNGCFIFNDYSISEKFSIEANPIYVVSDSIYKKHKRVDVSFNSGIQPYGNLSVTLSIDPKDTGNFDMKYNLQNLPVSISNPYLIKYTSFPLDRGTLELNGTWKVRNSIINSENHLVVIDPRVTRRIRNKNTSWIPLPLIMSFVRERGNVIDYEIPITGNLKNPKFHFRDVILDMVRNIFVKPPTTPYRMEVKNIENKIEKLLTLKWEIRQSSLMSDQERFLNKMADFLVHNPKDSISVYPIQYAEKEKESILFFEAKKEYFLLANNKKVLFLSKDDSIKVERMSVKESLFVHYLNKHVRGNFLFTIQDKCNNFIGTDIINDKFDQLNKEREKTFMLPFKKKSVENRIKINTAENNIPYNGFSFYKIVYNGELPKALIKAYKQMDELNDEAPRKGYEKEREKIKKEL